MAVVGINLATAASTTDGSSYNTASITPTANALVLLWVYHTSSAGAAPQTVSVTGNGLTWVQVGSTQRQGTTATGLSLFRAMGASPTAGAVTITFGANVTGACWSVAQFTGVDTTGTNGSGAIVQVVGNGGTATSLTVTLAAFSSTNNATAAGFATPVNQGIAAGSGFTALGTSSHNTPAHSLGSEWRADNDTSADMSWTTSSAAIGLAVEIKCGPATLTQAASTFYEDGTETGSTAISQDTITYDADAGLVENGFQAGATETWNHTVAVQDSRFLVTSVELWQDVAGTGTITAMTYAGVAMTKAQGVTNGAMRSEIWYLQNPATGTNAVTATISGSTDDRKFRSVSYYGVGGLDTSTSASGSSGNPTVSVTTGRDYCVVQDSLMRFSTTAATVGSGQTQVLNNVTGSSLAAVSYEKKTTAGSVTMDWTGAVANDWVTTALSMYPSARITRTVNSDSDLALRVRLQESSGIAGVATDDYQLQYSQNGGTYTNVGTGAVVGFNSASLTDGNATTNRLGAGSGSFVAGEISEDGLVDDHAITASNYTEYLYSITIASASVSNGDTLDFKVLRNGTALDTYTVTPRVTVSKATNVTATPGVLSLTISTFAPTVTAQDAKLVTPNLATLSLTTFAPVVTVTNTVTVGLATLTLTTFAPTVTATDVKLVIPAVKALTLTTFAPQVNLTVIPALATLTLTSFAPVVTASDTKVATPGVTALSLTTFAPVVTATANMVATPDTLALVITSYSPSVTTGNNKQAVPATAALVLTTFSPTATATTGSNGSYKIRVSGTYAAKPVKMRAGGVFNIKPVKYKKAGVFTITPY